MVHSDLVLSPGPFSPCPSAVSSEARKARGKTTDPHTSDLGQGPLDCWARCGQGHLKGGAKQVVSGLKLPAVPFPLSRHWHVHHAPSACPPLPQPPVQPALMGFELFGGSHLWYEQGCYSQQNDGLLSWVSFINCTLMNHH